MFGDQCRRLFLYHTPQNSQTHVSDLSDFRHVFRDLGDLAENGPSDDTTHTVQI